MTRTHESLWGESRTPEQIAAADDTRSRKTFELYCGMLARSLAQVVNVVDPYVIVLGGGLSNIDNLYPRLNELIARFTFSGRCRTPIVGPAGGDASGVIGAAWLWLDAGR
jgi:fructokinase